ncbi:MAG: hypothetical protein AB7Q37_12465 [Pyrinomonadaceae bacterium]
MKRKMFLFLILFGFAVTGLSQKKASASENRAPVQPEIYPPSAQVHGRGQVDWLISFWEWTLRVRADRNPVFDATGQFCREDQSGKLFYLSSMFIIPGGTAVRNCTVPSDVSVYIPILGTFCSPVTDGTTTTTESRACARAYGDNVVNTQLWINNQPTDFTRHRFTGGPFSLNVPDGNIFELFGFPPGGFEIENGILDGYSVILKPMRPGQHRIRVYGENNQFPGFFWDITYNLNVTPSANDH